MPERTRDRIFTLRPTPKMAPNLTDSVPQKPTRRPRMIALIQRVTGAEARIDDRVAGAIGRGILALVGVQKGDTPGDADRLLEKVLSYRVFPDTAGRMNLS